MPCRPRSVRLVRVVPPRGRRGRSDDLSGTEDAGEDHATPATCGGRTPSSTAWTSQTFLDSNDDGRGDFAGLAERIDYLAELGVTCLWLMPFYPTPGPRRRLRHHRLLRRRPAPGQPRRLRRGRPHRPRPRHAGHRRPGRQPHLRPASRGSGRRARAGPRRTGTSTSGATSTPADTTAQVAFPGEETSIWQYDEKAAASTTCTASTAPSRTSTSTNPAGARRDRQDHRRSGWSSASPASGSTPFPFCSTTTGVEPGRAGRLPDPHEFLRDLRAFIARRTGDAMLLGEVNLPRTGQLRLLRRRGRRRADHAVRLHRDAEPVPGAGPPGRRARSSRRLRQRPPLPARVAVGDLRPQPRRAHPRQAHRRRAARRCSPPSGPSRTCSSTAAACADACRRCSTATRGGIRMVYSLLFSLPGHPGAVLRRGDRHGREPRDRRPPGRAHADAVDRETQRRLLDRRARRGCVRPLTTAASGPSTSTSPPSCAIRSRSSRS